jgi:hypothetical protein
MRKLLYLIRSSIFCSFSLAPHFWRTETSFPSLFSLGWESALRLEFRRCYTAQGGGRWYGQRFHLCFSLSFDLEPWFMARCPISDSMMNYFSIFQLSFLCFLTNHCSCFRRSRNGSPRLTVFCLSSRRLIRRGWMGLSSYLWVAGVFTLVADGRCRIQSSHHLIDSKTPWFACLNL